jgi:hypothetical protein
MKVSYKIKNVVDMDLSFVNAHIFLDFEAKEQLNRALPRSQIFQSGDNIPSTKITTTNVKIFSSTGFFSPKEAFKIASVMRAEGFILRGRSYGPDRLIFSYSPKIAKQPECGVISIFKGSKLKLKFRIIDIFNFSEVILKINKHGYKICLSFSNNIKGRKVNMNQINKDTIQQASQELKTSIKECRCLFVKCFL